MRRYILSPLVALFGLLAWAVGPAAAQNIYPYQAPRFGPGYQTQLSPYLQMLRFGDPAANYYLGVVPEFQRREDRNRIYGSLQGFSNLLPARPQLTERDIDTPLRSTGHPTAFGYTGSYFGGINQFARGTGNPFPQQQGQGNRWPNNAPQPAGKPPVKIK
jgi:hypothetical protein